MAEESPASFESLIKAKWPDADYQEASRRADEAAAAVLRVTQSPSFFARLLAASIALHLGALAALMWLEHAPPLKPDLALEIPVDLVSQPPSSGTPGVPQSKAAPRPGSQTQSKPAASKPAPAKPSASKPVSPPKPAAAKPPAAQPPKPQPPKPQSAKVEAPKPPPPAPQPSSPAAAKPAPAPLPQLAPAAPPQPAPQLAKPMPASAPTAPLGSPEGKPSGLMQDDSPAVTVPKPTEDGDDIVSYQTLVFGMLALKKQFPEDARRRGAYGTAHVAFELNDDGSVKSEKLLDSSGDAALDVESLAVVQRAAPFPKPPPGAQKVFAVDIIFGAPK